MFRQTLRFLALSLLLLASTIAWAGSYRLLHQFGAYSQHPSSGLVADASGNLYGTTELGGGANLGIIYQISFATGFHQLYSFSGPDGADPSGNLVIDSAGNLYGTTLGGGISGCGGSCGVVYRLSPPTNGDTWSETVLYEFSGGDDGSVPEGLLFDSSGNLYGTAYGAGSLNCGTVFSLTPSENGQWTQHVLYAFTGDGCNPTGTLIFDGSGNLYGTTFSNGVWGGGTAFQLSPSNGEWTYTAIHEFNPNVKDGAHPSAGLVFDSAGNLYGTTPTGGAFERGTVYELTPDAGSWTERIIHHFGKDNDGNGPAAALVIDDAGNLYGTTTYGGGANRVCGSSGCGTLFRLTVDQNDNWNETVFALGRGQRGSYPYTSLLLDSEGHAFGTTGGGGSHNDGVVFGVTVGP